MILVDTNVISEPLKPDPDQKVVDWIDRQVSLTLFVSAISLAELWFGIEKLNDGKKKKKQLANDLKRLLEHWFEDRICTFDAIAALKYAPIMAQARKTGRAISVQDGQIAAIAQSCDFAVATRDVAPFEAAGLNVINPWNRQ